MPVGMTAGTHAPSARRLSDDSWLQEPNLTWIRSMSHGRGVLPTLGIGGHGILSSMGLSGARGGILDLPAAPIDQTWNRSWPDQSPSTIWSGSTVPIPYAAPLAESSVLPVNQSSDHQVSNRAAIESRERASPASNAQSSPPVQDLYLSPVPDGGTVPTASTSVGTADLFPETPSRTSRRGPSALLRKTEAAPAQDDGRNDSAVISDVTRENEWIPGAQYAGSGHHFLPYAHWSAACA